MHATCGCLSLVYHEAARDVVSPGVAPKPKRFKRLTPYLKLLTLNPSPWPYSLEPYTTRDRERVDGAHFFLLWSFAHNAIFDGMVRGGRVRVQLGHFG